MRQATVRFQDATLKGEFTTVYALEPVVTLWVPVHFTEHWSATNEEVTGDAAYSDWHRFEVTSRIK